MNNSHITDPHITAWALAFILFVIALILNKQGKAKGFKMVQMILRVFYLLIIITGGLLLFSLVHITFPYIVKATAGLWVISLLELILIRTAAKGRTLLLWFQFVVALLLVLSLGFTLPIGIHRF